MVSEGQLGSWSCASSSVGSGNVDDVVESGCDGSAPGSVPEVEWKGERTDKAGD